MPPLEYRTCPRTRRGEHPSETVIPFGNVDGFLCNICCARNNWDRSVPLDRDVPSCSSCNSNVRFRWTVHALSVALFGRSLPLPEFPIDKRIKGIGLSDESIYADLLARKLDYTNTFYDVDPRFDVTDLEWGQSAS